MLRAAQQLALQLGGVPRDVVGVGVVRDQRVRGVGGSFRAQRLRELVVDGVRGVGQEVVAGDQRGRGCRQRLVGQGQEVLDLRGDLLVGLDQAADGQVGHRQRRAGDGDVGVGAVGVLAEHLVTLEAAVRGRALAHRRRELALGAEARDVGVAEERDHVVAAGEDDVRAVAVAEVRDDLVDRSGHQVHGVRAVVLVVRLLPQRLDAVGVSDVDDHAVGGVGQLLELINEQPRRPDLVLFLVKGVVGLQPVGDDDGGRVARGIVGDRRHQRLAGLGVEGAAAGAGRGGRQREGVGRIEVLVAVALDPDVEVAVGVAGGRVDHLGGAGLAADG